MNSEMAVKAVTEPFPNCSVSLNYRKESAPFIREVILQSNALSAVHLTNMNLLGVPTRILINKG